MESHTAAAALLPPGSILSGLLWPPRKWLSVFRKHVGHQVHGFHLGEFLFPTDPSFLLDLDPSALLLLGN